VGCSAIRSATKNIWGCAPEELGRWRQQNSALASEGRHETAEDLRIPWGQLASISIEENESVVWWVVIMLYIPSLILLHVRVSATVGQGLLLLAHITLMFVLDDFEFLSEIVKDGISSCIETDEERVTQRKRQALDGK
jgi:hypothetical protein